MVDRVRDRYFEPATYEGTITRLPASSAAIGRFGRWGSYIIYCTEWRMLHRGISGEQDDVPDELVADKVGARARRFRSTETLDR